MGYFKNLNVLKNLYFLLKKFNLNIKNKYNYTALNFNIYKLINFISYDWRIIVF